MTQDFCLSDKIKYSTSNGYDRYWHFEAGDVKEFIKRLKSFVYLNVIMPKKEYEKLIEGLNKISGEKLI